MEFKNKMESWNVPPKSSCTFQTASVLFTPAHLCGEAGRAGREGGNLWPWPLPEIQGAGAPGVGRNLAPPPRLP